MTQDSIDAEGFRDACRHTARLAEALGLGDYGYSIGEVVDTAIDRLSAAQPVPAPEVSRGVVEHLAGIFRSIAEEKLDGALDRMTWRAAMLAAATIVEEDARRRDPRPADDGADCCRERTTAGGCGCES